MSSIFFPRVAASSRAQADRAVADVARLTGIVAAGVALAIVPTALLILQFVLPHYTGSLPALLVLLPGTASLSLTKVLTGYLTGLGKAAPVSTVATVAVVVNIGCNLALIPVWGIVGAAVASLVSYSSSAVMTVWFAARVSGVSPRDFFVPRLADLRSLWLVGGGVVRSLIRARPGHAA